MRTITVCLLVMSTCLGMAATTATATPRHVREAEAADTCVFTKAGRRIGCLQTIYGENVSFWTQGTRMLMGAGLPKDIEKPKPEVVATAQGSGKWIVSRWGDGHRLGRVVAVNSGRTRWKITNARGVHVATARGSEGVRIAMALLYYGRDMWG